MVEDAAAQGCRIVVLPECLDAGWAHPEARRLAEPIPGRHSDLLAAAARKAGIYVAVSFIGLLDELAVFNRPLTADEISLLRRQPGVLAGLKGKKDSSR